METPEIIILNEECTGKGGAESCKAAHKAGANVHVITKYDPNTESLVMPSWHFTSVEHGKAALTLAYENAPTIKTDAELYAAREAKIPHKLPVGWIDPSRR